MNHNGPNSSPDSGSPDETRRQSTQERQFSVAGSNPGDAIALVSANGVLEQYRDHLPRRKGHRRKATEGCGGLSSTSWIFLILALLQFLTVSGLQIAISVLGEFTEARLDEYVGCLQDSLVVNTNISDNFTIPDNSTFPRFGQDKQIYIYFFILLVLYNFALCIYALKQQNIVEVYGFMVLNILAMAYACLQVYQFRGFGTECSAITTVGYLALANVFVLLLFTVFFGLLSLTIYVEFGWKTYRLLNCNPAMRYYYRVYQILMSVIKMLMLFLLMFAVGQCVLILTTDNYEFGLSILMAFGILFIAYPVIYLILTNEWRLGYAGMLIIAFLIVLYGVFKIYRFSSLSCPLCEIRVEEVNNTTETILQLFPLAFNVTLSEALGLTRQELIVLFSLDREEDFANLILLASMFLIFDIVAVVVFIHHLRFYNKGLKEYFDEQQPNMYLNQHCLRRCYMKRTQYDVTDGSKGGKRLQLTMAPDKGKKKASQISTTRDSRLEETFNAPQPDFNEAYRTVSPVNDVSMEQRFRQFNRQ